MQKILILALMIFTFTFQPENIYAKKSLKTSLREERLSKRSYEGSPPVIPHGVKSLGRNNCLSCHKNGEAVKNGKTSPITPHPEWINCGQCHVEKKSKTLFRSTTYTKHKKVVNNKPANPLGPPYIPHHIQNRENCEICHIRETAKEAIIPKHGKRSNCTQCHVQLLKEPLHSKRQNRR